MANVNKIMLIGSLGDNAEVRQVGQNSVAKFSLATSERYKKADGTLAEETTWHRVELWGNAGVYQFLLKGTQVYVEGMYKTNDWVDQQGIKHRDYFVKAFSVQLLGSKPQSEQTGTAPAPGYAPQGQPAYAPQTYQPRPVSAPPTPPTPPNYPAPPQYAQPPIPPQAPVPTAFPPQPSNSGAEDLPF